MKRRKARAWSVPRWELSTSWMTFKGKTEFDVAREGLLVNVGMLADIPASSPVGSNEVVLSAVDSLVIADTPVGKLVVPLEDKHTVVCFRRGCVKSRPLHPNASGVTLISLHDTSHGRIRPEHTRQPFAGRLCFPPSRCCSWSHPTHPPGKQGNFLLRSLPRPSADRADFCR